MRSIVAILVSCCVSRRSRSVLLLFCIAIIVWMLWRDVPLPATPTARLNPSDYEALRSMSIVYTWVDDSDESFLGSLNQFGLRLTKNKTNSRVRNNGELRYSLRSLRLAMPWHTGMIYIVTPPPGQKPKWLKPDLRRVRIINQDTLMPARLSPTFNSNTVEKYIHNIPGLTDYFLQINDDYFFTGRMYPWDFFTYDEATQRYGIKLRLENNVVLGHKEEAEDLIRKKQRLWLASVFTTRAFAEEKLGSPLRNPPLYFTKHAPYAYYRPVLVWMAEQYRETYEMNAKDHKFRHFHDIVIPFLHEGVLLKRPELVPYTFLRGDAAESTFILLSDDLKRNEMQFQTFLAHRTRILACNDELNTPAASAQLRNFLQRMFPQPSDLEIPEETSL